MLPISAALISVETRYGAVFGMELIINLQIIIPSLLGMIMDLKVSTIDELVAAH
jgi:hypothetical protein